jgi:hypothetical protein
MRFRFAFFALARVSSFPKSTFAQVNLEPNLGKQANPAAASTKKFRPWDPLPSALRARMKNMAAIASSMQ